MTGNLWRDRPAQKLPFYYGWVILTMASVPSFSTRSLMSVAALSVFVVPMTDSFGWSRGLFSGAVSLGALCGLLVSPFAGRLIDRYGSGLMIGAASVVAGLSAIGLATVTQAWTFYALYVPGRAVFSSPLELGTSTAVSNWFIRRRPMALAIMGVVQGVGLTIFPLIAQILINGWGWRTAWASLGVFTLAVGVAPIVLLMARRPEDMGLAPDPDPQARRRRFPLLRRPRLRVQGSGRRSTTRCARPWAPKRFGYWPCFPWPVSWCRQG